MTLPNKLTLSRLILIPFFLVFFYFLNSNFSLSLRYASSIICLLLYTYMEITDLLDGKIARKYNLVTDLGKVFDPFADSLMHLSFFISFAHLGLISFLSFYVIMIREFLIVFIRLLLIKCGTVMPANIFGKFKTVFYALLSFLVIIYSCIAVFVPEMSNYFGFMKTFFYTTSYLAAFFSLLSFGIYFVKGVIINKALSNLSM